MRFIGRPFKTQAGAAKRAGFENVHHKLEQKRRGMPARYDHVAEFISTAVPPCWRVVRYTERE